jgi:alkylhydroperoxidase/carboxymuconolactone decarboxylase family protein YurZ
MVGDPPIAAGIIATIRCSGRLQMAKEMKEFAGLFYREGALDPKTMSLVALAAMAAAGCTS